MAVLSRLLAIISFTMVSPAMAQSPTRASVERAEPAGPAGREVRAKALTGKERLGDKSTDDQRLDNCKVPIEKQGVRKRRGTCDHLRIGMVSPAFTTTFARRSRHGPSNADSFTRGATAS